MITLISECDIGCQYVCYWLLPWNWICSLHTYLHLPVKAEAGFAGAAGQAGSANGAARWAVALQDQRQQQQQTRCYSWGWGSICQEHPRFTGTDCSPPSHTHTQHAPEPSACRRHWLLAAKDEQSSSLYTHIYRQRDLHTLTANGPTPPHCVRHASPPLPGTHRLHRSGSTEPSWAVVVKGGQGAQVTFMSCDHLTGLKVPAGYKTQNTRV